MKLIPFVVCIAMVVLLTVPKDSEAPVPAAWFIRIAAVLGVKLVKNSYYARCNTRNTPPEIKCPRQAFGVGLSRHQAQNAARAYAIALGNSQQCGGIYFGHCDIKKFRK